MSRKLTFNIGDKVIRFNVDEFDDKMDLDKLLKIDYSNLMAELLTFPVVVNRFGLLATELDNAVQESKLDLKIYEAKAKQRLRIKLQDENGKKPTIAEVDDAVTLDKIHQKKTKKYYTVLRDKEYMYSIYQSAKDKSYKLDKLSMTLKHGDMDNTIIQKQLNKVYFQIQKGRISED